MGGVYIVKGSDPVLRNRELSTLLDGLVGTDDRSFCVEEHTVPGKATATGDEDDESTDDTGGADAIVTAIVNAAQSPPFMTARRIVVVRDYEALPAGACAPIVDVIGDLLDTTDLVFVAGGGRVVKALGDALKGANVRGGTAEKINDVLQRELDRAGLSMKADAARTVAEHLGDDAGRLGGLVDLWASTYGGGHRLELDEVTPYLNESGAVRPYVLNNHIEAGDVASALEVLDRLLTVTSPTQPKPLHPLQVLGILSGRYRKLARLDSDTVVTVDDAHRVWGGKGSTFPAKKALDAARSLGPGGFAPAFDILHRADIQLKGASGLPEGTVLEIAVARLANLHRGGSGRGAGSARRPAGRSRS
ncbi:MAG: hypothetical protein JJE46_05490 [Acidimicrobiia bacterium]|nr:hypothetical protein [Acidimicrobiia bacterium]